MSIHWFPGHMAKTRRLITDSLKLVDGVIHLADARLPISSQNPLLYKLAGNKPTVLVLAKSDLADPKITKVWDRMENTLAISLMDNKHKQKLLNFINDYLEQKLTKRYTRPWRVMVVGIPNVGKSTLINLLAGRRSAKVGDKPGITRTKQWIKISPELEMLDMPGILWPKIDDKAAGLKLAAAGCIKDEILPVPEVATWLLGFLAEHYPKSLEKRFGTNQVNMNLVAEQKGAMQRGGEADLDKAAELLLKDYRSGRLGGITLDLGTGGE